MKVVKNMYQKNLLEWYQENKRELEFRKNRNPYYIWISEIMAQQTRIEAMIPYFKRFVSTLPTMKDLAECEEDVLKKLWQGLGYYSRCKNLQKCARVCMEKYDGKLPNNKKELMGLPGIGPYTAGAIASICFDEKVSAIDGNVIRVFSRLYDIQEDVTKSKTKKQIEELVNQSLYEPVSEYNQAIMELGAMICIPKNPRCALCPIRKDCRTKEPAKLPVYPEKKKRKIEKKTFYVLVSKEGMHLKKRGESGLLAGLYGFEETCPEDYIEKIPLEPYVHIFSHVEWHMDGYLVFVKSGKDFYSIEDIKENYALPSAFMPFFNQSVNLLSKKAKSYDKIGN